MHQNPKIHDLMIFMLRIEHEKKYKHLHSLLMTHAGDRQQEFSNLVEVTRTFIYKLNKDIVDLDCVAQGASASLCNQKALMC